MRYLTKIWGSMLLFSFLLSFSGCSSMVGTMYGIKQPQKLSDQEIIRFAEKYNIPLTDNYILDTGYLTFLSTLDTVKYGPHIKNHYQPLQALYYDKKGDLVSFQINCYAGGFPNLKWNSDNRFEVFPPKNQAPPDTLVPLKKQQKYLHPLPPAETFSNKQSDYVVIVYWSKFMGRQSKRLIRTVQNNVKLASGYKITIIYANNDNVFAGKTVE